MAEVTLSEVVAGSKVHPVDVSFSLNLIRKVEST